MSMFTPYSLVNQCILLKGVNKTRKEGISLCQAQESWSQRLLF